MINEKFLKNELIKKGGLTLNKNLEVLTKKEGYIATYQNSEKTFAFNELAQLKNEILKRAENIKKDEFIGLWVDNNIIYLDTSIILDNKTECLEFAKNNRQIAIFDLKENKSLYLKDYHFIKIYTIYNKFEQVVAQFDSLEEVANFLEITKKAVKNIISENKKTKKEMFTIKKDYVLVN